MGLFQRLFGGAAAAPARSPRADGGSVVFQDLHDPAFLEFMRGGVGLYGAGPVRLEQALRNPAVFRCVTLISSAIGMLPLHLISDATKETAGDHPLDRILHRQPNAWQSAFDFRSLMQLRALSKGNAYALVIRSTDVRTNRSKIARLVPLDPDRVTPKLNEGTWRVSYDYRSKTQGTQTYGEREIFHLRGQSLDGLNGVALVQQAADSIRLALDAELAMRNVFKNGSFIGGTLEAEKELSAEAYDRLVASWQARHTGVDTAGSTPLLEGGVKYNPAGASVKDAETNALRGRQVEEIARVFGVPRPLLMVDETSWGSGIDVLGQFFVRFALNPWFEAWQQAIERTLLEDDEKDRFSAKFNYGALIRGSMKDQGDFFAKALGAGGHHPFMTPNEVRDLLDMPRHADGDRLANPMMGHNGGPVLDT